MTIYEVGFIDLNNFTTATPLKHLNTINTKKLCFNKKIVR